MKHLKRLWQGLLTSSVLGAIMVLIIAPIIGFTHLHELSGFGAFIVGCSFTLALVAGILMLYVVGLMVEDLFDNEKEDNNVKD